MANQEKLFYDGEELKDELPFSPVLERVGLVLKAEREKQGIELKTISQKLCIRESFLKALEDGDYDVFPALVYGGGFLRSYASFLGLDAKSIMVRFHAETENLTVEDVQVAPVVHKNVMPSKRLLVSLAGLILVGLIGYYLYDKKDEFLSSSTAVFPAEVVEIEAPVQPAPVSTDTLVQEAQPEAVDVKALSQELKSLIPQAQDELSTLLTGEVFGAKERGRVVLLSTNKVWVEVKKENKVIFSKVMNQGDAYQVPLDATDMQMRTGNAGALSVFIDGKLKKVVGKEGHILKNIPLMPEAYETE